ncbi:MAG: MopE-related protein [Chitinophagales bacterium]
MSTDACTAPVNFVADNTDCDDSQLLYVDGDGDGVGAGAPAACGVTTNTDCNDADMDATTLVAYYEDLDGDNYGSANTASFCAGTAPSGYSENTGDCDDTNNDINPGATEICNNLDDNCNGTTDEGFTLSTFYADAEGDGFGDASSTTTACVAPVGYVDNSLDCQPLFITYADADGDYFGFGAPIPCGPVINNADCDDTQLLYADSDGDGFGSGVAVECGVATNTDCAPFNNTIYPGATEICNGIDEDCDGTADNGVTLTYYVDADGDNFGAGDMMAFCSDPGTGYSVNDADCDDTNSSIYPSATEICNAIDEDCDGVPDNGLTFTTYYADADGDTHGDVAVTTTTCDGAPMGYVSNSDDCDDTDDSVYPGVIDLCNGIDNDCDGNIDDDALFTTYYLDNDGDTYGDQLDAGTTFCYVPAAPYVLDNTDCNDADGSINPGETEICNGIDDDCSGVHDDGGVVFLDYYVDADGDGYGQGAAFGFCEAPVSGWSLTTGDCDDGNDAINPGETEICNGIDDDCSGVHDDGGVVFLDYYVDADGDSYGQGAAFGFCEAPVSGWSLTTGDCDDADDTVYPGVIDLCNGIDNDCDGNIDDDALFTTYYLDNDGDTYGDQLDAGTTFCYVPAAPYVLDNTDCDDSDLSINPGATEICNAMDEDCDGIADDGLTFITYYRDADGDTYGNAAVTTTTCDGAPIGYVIDDEDCDDSDLSINPGATEICNAMDEDCDGIVDDGLTFVTYYKDNDGDGYGAGLYGTVTTCDGAPATYVDNDLDCEDFNATINPAADDVCNFIDDNCSGAADEGLPIFTFYLDADGDTYGNPGATLEACGPFGVMWVENSEDCDDADADVHPGVIDECNGIDNDCDGNIDDDALFTTYYLDNDGDTYGDNLDAGTTFCYVPAAPYVLDNTDCNDSNNTAYPGAAELCDGIDNDCDGSTDEDLVTASVSPAGPTVLCKGDFIELTANAGPGYMYQWYKNGNLIPGATSITYNTNKSGYFQVEVSLAGGCSVLSATHGISVIAKPNANITAPNGTSLCASVKLKASYGGGYSWQWYLDGSPIPGANDYLYFPTVAGSYACRVTNASGCSRNTPAIAVTACKEGELVDGVITETFDIYPNPTIGEFVIDMTLNTTATSADMQLLNIMGEIVYNNSVSVNNGSIIESIQLNDNVPSGMYIVKVVVDGTEYTKQLVLQK